MLLFCGFGGEFSENGCFEVALRWMGGEGNHPPPAFGGRSPFLCGGRRGGAWGVGTAGRAGGEGMDVLNLHSYRKDDSFVCDKMAKY